jgi:hypothetical protein
MGLEANRGHPEANDGTRELFTRAPWLSNAGDGLSTQPRRWLTLVKPRAAVYVACTRASARGVG